jgi:hypothetical protein
MIFIYLKDIKKLKFKILNIAKLMKFKFFAINAGVDVIKIKEEPH